MKTDQEQLIDLLKQAVGILNKNLDSVINFDCEDASHSLQNMVIELESIKWIRDNELSTFDKIYLAAKKVNPNMGFNEIRWYVAYQIADDLTDQGTKAIARILDGDDIPGVTTKTDIENWFIQGWEDYENIEDPEHYPETTFELWVEGLFKTWANKSQNP